jgi:pimeloyl-ACP methyl ester carboxylesterase
MVANDWRSWLMVWGVTLATSAQCDESQVVVRTVVDASGHETTEIIIPAPNAQVAWADIATAVIRAANLNGDALRGMLPGGTIDLKEPASDLLLFAANLGLGEGLQLTRETSGTGQMQLRVFCDLKRIRDRYRLAKTNAVNPDSTGATLKSLVAYRPARVEWDSGQRTTRKIGVLCVHGYASQPESLEPFRERLRESGWRTGSFGYDYRQSIAISAEQLQLACRQSVQEHRCDQFVIVAHSMGGLVARAMLEMLPNPPTEIRQLIMVATPNQGSQWAHCPPVLGARDGEGIDFASLTEALLGIDDDQGFRDLRPGSEFLTKLNQSKRPTNINYTCIVGTGGPLLREEAIAIQQEYKRMLREHRAVQLLQPRLDPFFSDLSEMIRGEGDGAVAIGRCAIKDVDDCLRLPFTHTSALRGGDTVPGLAVVNAIKQRLVECEP